MGIPEGTGLFSELFINMIDEIQRNKYKQTLFGAAPNMSTGEKKISFLNRYFIYKKVREVNIDKLHLELGEYDDAVLLREKEETNKLENKQENIQKRRDKTKYLTKQHKAKHEMAQLSKTKPKPIPNQYQDPKKKLSKNKTKTMTKT